MNNTAVILTCYNRCSLTIKCLTKLFSLYNNLDVYLVDDNSTDGTLNEIAQKFPKVHLIKGSGNLYWNRGMRLAWSHAARKGYDNYIWLNDDVILYDFWLEELFLCQSQNQSETIISGVIESHDKSKVIYGGFDQKKRLILPNGISKEITYLNGNVVLVPKSVFKVLGNFDPVFHHDLGDVDYGLRAKKHGVKVVTTRKAVGSGETNDFCRVRVPCKSIIKRFRKLYSPLGSNPNITFYFRKKHYGYFSAISYYIFIHLLVITESI